MEAPLHGLRIVEVSAFIAAPLGGMTLAQLVHQSCDHHMKKKINRTRKSEKKKETREDITKIFIGIPIDVKLLS